MVAVNHALLPVFVLLSFSTGADARPDIAGPVAAEVERVIDGDTIRVLAKIWVDQHVSVSVRLRGIDAPELFRPQCEAERAIAQRAKSFVEDAIGAGVTLREVDNDKYGGRVVARLETSSGLDIGAALLAEGLAVEMGARDPWCG